MFVPDEIQEEKKTFIKVFEITVNYRGEYKSSFRGNKKMRFYDSRIFLV